MMKKRDLSLPMIFAAVLLALSQFGAVILFDGANAAVPDDGDLSGDFAAAATDDRVSRAPGQIAISGTSLLKDGKFWVPKMMDIVGTNITPILVDKKCVPAALRTAYRNLSKNSFKALQKLGADTVRITIFADGFDPGSTAYDPDYPSFVEKWVGYARSIGLNVVLTMHQSQVWKLCGTPPSEMPDTVTTLAWKAIAPYFAKDHGVLFDLYAEPFSTIDSSRDETPGSDDWTVWQRDFNELVKAVRGTGADNIVIVAGLEAGKIFNADYPIVDSANNHMWGIHVYFNAMIPFTTPVDWDRYFGKFCRTSGLPCLITEWQAAGYFVTGARGVFRQTGCKGNAPAQAAALIAYAMANKWGIGGWAFDVPNTVMVDSSMIEPTNYANWDPARGCRSSPPWGNGKLLFRAFNNPKWDLAE